MCPGKQGHHLGLPDSSGHTAASRQALQPRDSWLVLPHPCICQMLSLAASGDCGCSDLTQGNPPYPAGDTPFIPNVF